MPSDKTQPSVSCLPADKNLNEHKMGTLRELLVEAVCLWLINTRAIAAS